MNEPHKYMALGLYEMGPGFPDHGKPEEELLALLADLGTPGAIEGAGTQLSTGERDVEVGFVATPQQVKKLMDALADAKYGDVWEVELEGYL